MPKRNLTTSKPIARRIRGILGGFALLSCLLVASVAAFSFRAPTEARAEESSWTPNAKEKPVEHTELATTAVSSTLTGTSQSVTVTFRSKKIEAYANGARYKNVFVVPDPAPGESSWEESKVLEEAAEEIKKAEEEGRDPVLPSFTASVFNISYNSNAAGTADDKKIMVIPATVTRDKGFVLNVTSIGTDVCFNRNTDLVNYENITQIIIPKTITSIAEGAFYNVPESVQICCEAPEYYTDEETGEQMKTYPTNWTDATPVYDYVIGEKEQKRLNVATPSPEKFGKGSDFFLGYKSEEFDLPMWMEYQFEKLNEHGMYEVLPDHYWYEVPIFSANHPYDAVGSTMGNEALTQNINIENLPTGQRINAASIRFHNIYRAISDPTSEAPRMIPDIRDPELESGWNGEYYTVPAIAYSSVPHFEEFFTMKPESISTIGGFIQFEVSFTKVPGTSGYGPYAKLNPDIFKANKKGLDDGTLQVRYQFSSLDQAYYRFTLKDGNSTRTVSSRIRTPIKYVLVTGNGPFRMGFLVNTDDLIDSSTNKKAEGVNYNDLVKMEFMNFGVKTDIYKPETNSIITKSAVALRFGVLPLFLSVQTAAHTEIGQVIAWTMVVYTVIFAALAVAWFLYSKRAFRNDEFRRVNDKKFLIASIKNYVGFACITAAILFIYCRWALLRTTIVVFNPLDPFVVIFALAALIFLGFTIRNLVIGFKNNRKRKEAARLKLDQDVADDGTH